MLQGLVTQFCVALHVCPHAVEKPHASVQSLVHAEILQSPARVQLCEQPLPLQARPHDLPPLHCDLQLPPLQENVQFAFFSQVKEQPPCGQSRLQVAPAGQTKLHG